MRVKNKGIYITKFYMISNVNDLKKENPSLLTFNIPSKYMSRLDT